MGQEARDLFHLAGQAVGYLENSQVERMVPLYEQWIELPFDRIHNFEKEMSWEILENGDLEFKHKKYPSFFHRVRGLKASHLLFDSKEGLLFITTKSGAVHMMVAKSLRDYLFQSPIPVFKVAQWQNPQEPNLQIKSKDLRLQIIDFDQKTPKFSENLKRTIDLHPEELKKAYFSRGDLALLDPEGLTHAVFSRKEIIESSQAQAALIRYFSLLYHLAYYQGANQEGLDLVHFLDPDPRVFGSNLRSETIEKMKEFLEKDSIRGFLRSASGTSVIASMDYLEMESLLKELDQLQRSQKTLSQRVSLEALRERHQEIEKDREDAKKEAERLQEMPWYQRFQESLSNRYEDTKSKMNSKLDQLFLSKKKTLQHLQKTLLYGLAASGTFYFAYEGFQMVAPEQLQSVEKLLGWAVSSGAHWLTKIFPILGSSEWRWPNIRTGLILATLMPLSMLISKFAGALITKEYHTAKNWSVLGSRMFSVFLTPLGELFSKALKQPNLYFGLRAGIPLTTKELWNAPWADEKELVEKRLQLEELVKDRRFKRVMSAMIAFESIADRQRVHPLDVLDFIVEQKSEGKEVLNSKELKEFSRLGVHLFHELKSEDAKLYRETLLDLSSNELLEYLRAAEAFKEKLRSDSNFKSKWISFRESARLRFKEWKERLSEYIVGAIERFHEIRSTAPDQSTAKNVAFSAVVDHSARSLAYSLIGARADPSAPSNLAADPEGPIGVNRDHLVSNAYYWSSWTGKANTEAGLTHSVTEDRRSLYARSLNGEFSAWNEKAGFRESLAPYFKAVTNFKKAAYGYYGVRYISKKLTLFRSILLLGVTMRFVVDPSASVLGLAGNHLWHMAMATMWYNWIWYYVIRGNIHADRSFRKVNATAKKKMKELRERLIVLQGEHLIQSPLDGSKITSDTAQKERALKGAREAFREIRAIYQKAEKEVPKEFSVDSSKISTGKIDQFYRWAMLNPPSKAALSGKLFALSNLLMGVLPTAYLASSFDLHSYGDRIPLPEIGKAWLLFGGFVFGFYWVNRGVAHFQEKVSDFWRSGRSKDLFASYRKRWNERVITPLKAFTGFGVLREPPKRGGSSALNNDVLRGGCRGAFL
jgi:hypothetical protein